MRANNNVKVIRIHISFLEVKLHRTFIKIYKFSSEILAIIRY